MDDALLCGCGGSGFLALLPAYDLVLVAYTLSFIWLRLLDGTHRSRELPDLFLVRTGGGDHIFVDSDGEAIRYCDQYRVREADRELKLLAGKFRLEADTFDEQFFHERLINAVYHVANMGGVGTPKGTCEAGLAGRAYRYISICNRNSDIGMYRTLQGSALRFHRYIGIRDRDFGACGNWYSSFSYA